MERVGGPKSLFRTSFLDQGLVTFGECVEHYAGLDANELLHEMRLLLTAPMLAVPFGAASARYYALMDALIRCAGTNEALSEAQRSRLICICVDIAQFLRARTTEGRTAAFEVTLSTALAAVRNEARHPEVAEKIQRGAAQIALRSEAVSTLADTAAEMRALAFDEPPPALRPRVRA